MERTDTVENSNIISIPGMVLKPPVEDIPTPRSDRIFQKAAKLSMLSNYKSSFDFNTYRDLELRFGLEQPRGGITFNTTFKLANSHSTCQQCLYAFELDTYGRGCVHDCVYCYAKEQLTSHGYWNRPFPMPIDVTDLWNTFYTVFETDRPNKWRKILEKRIPIRIGSMSDSFMFMDKKYKVTQEVLRLLKYYNYPYIIFTRSDLIAFDEYINLLDENLCSVQMSIASTNDKMNKLIEPSTPSAKRRLKALEKLSRAGFWTTVRLNPFFPIHPDGYFSDPDFDRENSLEPFEFSSFEMVDEIAAHGVPAILAGFVRLSPFALNKIEKATGRNLREFFKSPSRKSVKDFHYSDEEIRAYYERIHAKCKQNAVQFTTCYIGNGENHFWKDQDLWDNKKDCCNAKERVNKFGSSSREIPWKDRLGLTKNGKDSKPNDTENLHKEL